MSTIVDLPKPTVISKPLVYENLPQNNDCHDFYLPGATTPYKIGNKEKLASKKPAIIKC